MSPAEETAKLLRQFGVAGTGDLVSYSPIDGAEIGRLAVGNAAEAAERAARAFLNGGRCRRPTAASWSASSERSFARPGNHWPGS